MQIPIDYHIIFILISIILLLFTILLIFIESTAQKTSAGVIIIMLNIIICIICALGAANVDMYGYNSDGELVHNINYNLKPIIIMYWWFFYVNFMLMIYCGYLFANKPWEKEDAEEENSFY